MSNGKEILQEAIKTLYKEGKRSDDIRAIFDPIVEKSEKICKARDTIVSAIIGYVDVAHPDMVGTYTVEDLVKFTTDQIFGTIDKDLEELRTLKADGYTKVSSSGTNSRPGLEGYDDEALKEFLRTLQKITAKIFYER